jgi:hypothetical protein
MIWYPSVKGLGSIFELEVIQEMFRNDFTSHIKFFSSSVTLHPTLYYLAMNCYQFNIQLIADLGKSPEVY